MSPFTSPIIVMLSRLSSAIAVVNFVNAVVGESSGCRKVASSCDVVTFPDKTSGRIMRMTCVRLACVRGTTPCLLLREYVTVSLLVVELVVAESLREEWFVLSEVSSEVSSVVVTGGFWIAVMAMLRWVVNLVRARVVGRFGSLGFGVPLGSWICTMGGSRYRNGSRIRGRGRAATIVVIGLSTAATAAVTAAAATKVRVRGCE